MDYKEKYEQALERARQFSEKPYLEDSAGIVEYIFPELRESDDEKVRKDIISLVIKWWKDDGAVKPEFSTQNSMIAWLEKQAEQPKKHDVCDNCDQQGSCVSPCPMKLVEKQGEQKPVFEMKTPEESLGIDSDTYNKIVDECVYGEQKPADKVEPKFKKGDWVVFNGLVLHVDEIVDSYYRTTTIDGIPNSYDWDIDSIARLWTIQEAKDGNVLYDGHKACILRKILKDDDAIWIDVYCGINIDEEFKVNDEDELWCLACVCTPATKEQRELLFQKMKEAGYEWDADKKELSQSKVTKISDQEWSEEDKETLDYIIDYIEKNKSKDTIYTKNTEVLEGMVVWLKSLKDRYTWKPSDEQMKALANALSLAKNCGEESAFDLRTLHDDLKRLLKI